MAWPSRSWASAHSVTRPRPLRVVRHSGVADRSMLLRRGLRLESTTLAWNVVGVGVLTWAAWSARSVALAGFSLDSLIEIGASTVVIWELTGIDENRAHRALRLIGVAFIALAIFLAVQSTLVLATGHRADPSPAGMAWSAITAVVMFSLAAGKARTGRALENAVLTTEGRVTLVDAILATAVLVGLMLNARFGWWWADPLAGYVLAFYAVREIRGIFSS